MKVSFVVPAFESMGVESLSAYLKQHGHKTHLAFDPQIFDNVFFNRPVLSRFFAYADEVIKELASAKPDVIGFSVTTYDFPWATKMARRIKKVLPVPIVFGGPHVWIYPEAVMDEEAVDFAVRGEGEEALLAILNHLESGKDEPAKIPNTLSRHNGQVISGPLKPPKVKIDDLPLPDKALFYDRMNHLYGYYCISNRVCHRGCAYCHYNVVKRLHYGKWSQRRMSVSNFLSELVEFLPTYRNQSVRIHDNNFVEDPKWVAEFAEGYAEKIAVPYHASVNPDSMTPEVIEDLRRSGCFEVQMGVQTINPETKKIIERPETLQQVQDAVNNTRRANIRCTVDLILGLPGEDEKDALASARFFNEHRPTKINVYWLDYLPHSSITETAYKMKLIDKKRYEGIGRGENSASMFQGGMTLPANRRLIRAQMLLSLAPILPTGSTDRVFNRVLKYFPQKMGPTLIWAVLNVLIRSPFDLHRKRYSGLHREFLLPTFLKRVKRFFKKH